jgi:predicted DNA-binding transcriptional regulator AlpA
MRIVRLPEVLRLTSLSRSTVWRLERANAFPVRRQLSPGAIGWQEDEIVDWTLRRPPTSTRT